MAHVQVEHGLSQPQKETLKSFLVLLEKVRGKEILPSGDTNRTSNGVVL